MRAASDRNARGTPAPMRTPRTRALSNGTAARARHARPRHRRRDRSAVPRASCCRRLLAGWQLDGEDRAALRVVGVCERAVEGLNDRLADREPDPQPIALRRDERMEDVVAELTRHAVSVIRHRDAN